MAVAELPLPPFPYEKDFFGSPFPKGGKKSALPIFGKKLNEEKLPEKYRKIRKIRGRRGHEIRFDLCFFLWSGEWENEFCVPAFVCRAKITKNRQPAEKIWKKVEKLTCKYTEVVIYYLVIDCTHFQKIYGGKNNE